MQPANIVIDEHDVKRGDKLTTKTYFVKALNELGLKKFGTGRPKAILLDGWPHKGAIAKDATSSSGKHTKIIIFKNLMDRIVKNTNHGILYSYA